MAHGLRDYFRGVIASDIHDYGFGLEHDFLTSRGLQMDARDPDWIITNPPFKLGEAFVRQGYRLARRGVAMLLRLQFLEGEARHKLFTEDCPLTTLAQFSERVPMHKGRWEPDGSTTTAYAWFIFDKNVTSLAPRVRWIRPGTKARLTKPGDRARFGLPETGALDLEAADA